MDPIAGIINPPDWQSALQTVKVMQGRNAESGCLLHDPIAALTGSAAEDRTGTLRLVFCGEIYNAETLRQTGSAADFLLRLYEEKGDLFARELDGRFVFALWDARKRKLLLGRDRAGEMPLYYFIRRNMLVFAGDLRALRRHPDFPAEWSNQAVADFLSLQYVPGPRTVYRNVCKLPPASVMRFFPDNGSLSIEKYWTLSFLPKQRISFADAKAELRSLVRKAVCKRLDPAGEPGVFLSGGVDSGIIAAVTAGLTGQTELPAFTIGFENAAYDERELAKASAQYINQRSACRLRLHEKNLPQISFRDFCKWFGNTGELYCDTSLLPAGALCAFAREQVGMALCGDAADELFGGYERYLVMRLAQRCNFLPEPVRKPFFRGLQCCFADAGERTFSGRIRRLCRTLGESAERQYFSILDRCPGAVSAELFGERLIGLADPAAAFILPHSAREAAEQCMETDFHLYLEGDTLPKMARAAAAVSLNVRSPFLDRDIMDFAASLPPEFKVCRRKRKYILREAFADMLAPEVMAGRKRGFGVPVSSYLRTVWQKEVPEVLFSERMFHGGWVTRQGVESLWKEHLDGVRDHSYILCNLLVLSLFLEDSALNAY